MHISYPIITAAVVDADGNAVSGVTVNFSSTNSSVATITSSAVTNSEGMATATITAGTTVGTTGIVASVSGVPSQVALLTTTPANTAPMLSNLTVTGQTVGQGTETSPAVAVDGNTITLSSTLTDASGNPLSGVQMTYSVTGTTTDVLANGSAISNNAVTVTTNASGVAALSLQYDGVGTSPLLTVEASAPFTSNGVMSNSSYVQWGQAGGVVLSQSSTNAQYSTYGNTSQGVVTYTATVLPETGVTTLSGIPVTFTMSAPSEKNVPYFTNAQGSVDLSTTSYVANTNSDGQAVAYVNSVLPEAAYSTGSSSVSVDASATVNSVTTTTSAETTTWNVAGVPATLSTAGFSASNSTPTQGSQVTLSGTVVDALGNPVANANLEVVGSNPSTDSYVSGGTSTSFIAPVAGTALSAGSNYGEEITTNASGDFSFVVTDSAAETDTYTLYNVMPNGEFSTASNLGYTSVTFGPATTVTTMGVGAGVNSLLAAYSSSTTPSTVPSTLSGIMVPSGTLASDSSISEIAAAPYLEIGGYNAVGSQVALSSTNPSVSYVVTGNNSGQIAAVDGVQLASPVSNATITFTYASAKTAPTVSVNGTVITPSMTPLLFSNSDPLAYVTIQDANTESDVFTATSGSAKATANVDFSNAAVSSVSMSSSFVQTSAGQPVNVTLTALNANLNPVPNATIYLNNSTTSGLDLTGVFITAVDGQQLTQYMDGSTEPTPVPLFQTYGSNPTAYTSVFANGISATNFNSSASGATPNVALMTGSNGEVEITLQSGNVGYAATTGASSAVYVYVYSQANSSSTVLNTYGTQANNSTSVGSGTFQW